MSDSAASTGIFLINTLFDLYLTVLGVRLILAAVKADHHNPIIHFIIKLTQPIIVPVRQLLPTYRNIELATLFWMIFLGWIKYSLISLLFFSGINLLVLLLFAIFGTIKIILNIFFYAILFDAILSFINPSPTPVTHVVRQISAPILNPLRRIIPPISGFDITPIPALILLQVFIRLL